MKITCLRESLTSAFALAASIAPTRSPKEILQNVKVTATGSRITLTATDLDVGIRLEVSEGVEVENEGAALLPVQRTMAILRESNDEKLTIESDDSGIRVTGSRSKYRLPGSNPDEFPSVAEFNEDKYHVLSTRLFREMVKRTVFATDAESSRYALGGVLLEMEGSSIIAVGTDGRRLAKMEGTGEPQGGHQTSGASTIVPTRAIQLMERALSDKDDTVDVSARANDLLLRTPRAVIYSRLVEGRYPSWRQVFPQREKAVQIDMTVGPLFAALRQAAIVTDHESRGIDFTFGDGTLKLEASTAEIGESQVELPIAYDGETITLTMDNRYVADFCKVLDSESSFVIEVESSSSPALLSTDDGYSYVIMPMARDR
ncbi:DNA polymerase III subunit beta [Novipirellula artificiosorum]|uniref:Beta sliding clamp n=1 Tax=Novipirellula artificiosorum TaxID=2528016 RepID=A0A5C6DW31_9BACT|nr:DNA polymerase III subunit beta [Novipirellula artificiosorum]TWU40802.1 DNA polymerase III subunit beta [Novipirellula artificiosorum]